MQRHTSGVDSNAENKRKLIHSTLGYLTGANKVDLIGNRYYLNRRRA